MASFGETLKRERELRDISLRQISEATKISIRYLEALEQNRFELLPGGLFNKGFIRAYATYVGLDSESMVNSYLHQLASSGPAPEAGPGGPRPGLHRPAMVPQRRAAQRPESAPAALPPSAAQVETVGRAALDARRAVSDARRATPDAASARSPANDRASAERASSARAVTDIETVDRTAASSRALLWIFSLVAGAGLVFLVLTLATGRPPQQAAPPSAPPDQANGTAPAPDPIDAAATEPKPAAQEPSASPGAPGRDAAAPAIASVGGTRPDVLPPLPPEARQGRDAGPAADEEAAAKAKQQWETEDAKAEEKERERKNAEARSARTASAPHGAPMELQVEAAASAWIQVTCDSERVVDGMMRPGETLTTQCLNVIRVSATDAGAVSLTINGAPCLSLGDPGTRVYGYTIRSDDFRRICPPGARGPDGRF